MLRLRKLATLDRAQLTELLEAQWALGHAQLLRWLRPTGAFLAPVHPPATPEAFVAPGADAQVEQAERLARAVDRVARNGLFRPFCLVRALALTRMLRSRGIHDSQLRVGVRWEEGSFAAHAWVEYRGRVLGDRAENVSRYAPLSDVEILPGGRFRPGDLDRRA